MEKKVVETFMRFYYTTGSTFETNEPPQRLGAFATFHAAESAARQLLISEPSGVIYLYVPASNCGVAGPPLEFMGWRARYCLVRIVTSLSPRSVGTPFLFGRFGLFDKQELAAKAIKEPELQFNVEETDTRLDQEKESPVGSDAILVSQDLRPSLSLA